MRWQSPSNAGSLGCDWEAVARLFAEATGVSLPRRREVPFSFRPRLADGCLGNLAAMARPQGWTLPENCLDARRRGRRRNGAGADARPPPPKTARGPRRPRTACHPSGCKKKIFRPLFPPVRVTAALRPPPASPRFHPIKSRSNGCFQTGDVLSLPISIRQSVNQTISQFSPPPLVTHPGICYNLHRWKRYVLMPRPAECWYKQKGKQT